MAIGTGSSFDVYDSQQGGGTMAKAMSMNSKGAAKAPIKRATIISNKTPMAKAKTGNASAPHMGLPNGQVTKC